jgi:hypothetical protein
MDAEIEDGIPTDFSEYEIQQFIFRHNLPNNVEGDNNEYTD